MLDKLKSALDKGVASVSVKSGMFLESSKISTHITTIQSGITQLKHEMADAIIEKWSKGEDYITLVEEAGTKIRELEAQIRTQRKKMEQIRQESQQILGETPNKQPLCPSCGGTNTNGAKFCHRCGTRLEG